MGIDKTNVNIRQHSQIGGAAPEWLANVHQSNISYDDTTPSGVDQTTWSGFRACGTQAAFDTAVFASAWGNWYANRSTAEKAELFANIGRF